MRNTATGFLLAICAGALTVCPTILDAAESPETPPLDSIAVQIEARKATLAGEIFLPGGARPAPGVVIVHGAGTLERQKYLGFVRKFVGMGMGMAVLLYDKRGVGESTGCYPDVSAKKSPVAIPDVSRFLWKSVA